MTLSVHSLIGPRTQVMVSLDGISQVVGQVQERKDINQASKRSFQEGLAFIKLFLCAAHFYTLLSCDPCHSLWERRCFHLLFWNRKPRPQGVMEELLGGSRGLKCSCLGPHSVLLTITLKCRVGVGGQALSVKRMEGSEGSPALLGLCCVFFLPISQVG